MTISLTMIVKNEENTLGRCLDSVRSVIDEIIIVDTGSTDRTKEIAASYGAKIFDFVWIDDFSAARQFAHEQATGDWIIWLDADDVVHGAERIPSRIAAAAPETKGFYWRYITAWNDAGEPTVLFWRERCVRNDGTYRWAGIVHEVLVSEFRQPTEYVDDVTVRHYPEASKPGDHNRNLEILSKQYEANNGSLEPRMLFYLGREYSDTGQHSRAIEILEQYETVSTWNDERYHAKLLLANLYAIDRNYDRATEIYYSAMQLYPLWPNAYFGLAAMCYFRQEWALNVHWTDIGKSLPPPDTMLFVNRRSLEYDWIINYTNGLYRLNRVRDALHWTEHALTISPTDSMHLNNQNYFKQLIASMPDDDPNGFCPPPDKNPAEDAPGVEAIPVAAGPA